jgi:hypothetical protein
MELALSEQRQAARPSVRVSGRLSAERLSARMSTGRHSSAQNDEWRKDMDAKMSELEAMRDQATRASERRSGRRSFRASAANLEPEADVSARSSVGGRALAAVADEDANRRSGSFGKMADLPARPTQGRRTAKRVQIVGETSGDGGRPSVAPRVSILKRAVVAADGEDAAPRHSGFKSSALPSKEPSPRQDAALSDESPGRPSAVIDITPAPTTPGATPVHFQIKAFGTATPSSQIARRFTTSSPKSAPAAPPAGADSVPPDESPKAPSPLMSSAEKAKAERQNATRMAIRRDKAKRQTGQPTGATKKVASPTHESKPPVVASHPSTPFMTRATARAATGGTPASAPRMALASPAAAMRMSENSKVLPDASVIEKQPYDDGKPKAWVVRFDPVKPAEDDARPDPPRKLHRREPLATPVRQPAVANAIAKVDSGRHTQRPAAPVATKPTVSLATKAAAAAAAAATRARGKKKPVGQLKGLDNPTVIDVVQKFKEFAGSRVPRTHLRTFLELQGHTDVDASTSKTALYRLVETVLMRAGIV